MLKQVLDIYELLKEIGSGGFGTVYLACRQTTNRIVAVKVLSPEFSSRPDFVECLLKEAHALRDLPGHPNIIALLDYRKAHDQYYLVLDNLGQDLRQTPNKKGMLSVRSELCIAAQVADALHVAARHGIVHCDIKPESI
jgi:eukaryotic-like serine/threonine-protein kinase